MSATDSSSNPRPELMLRPAGAGDTAAVADIHIMARRSAPMPAGVHSEDEIRRWIARVMHEDHTFLAEIDGNAVGYVRFGDSELKDLYVLSEHRREGVGTALLSLAKRELPEGFTLWVFQQNEPARRFYAREDLVTLEETDGKDNEEKVPDVRMAWLGARPLEFLQELLEATNADTTDLAAHREAILRQIDHQSR